MPSSLVISNVATGFETDREPFNIANDAFPTINNAFLWRGRVKKKRGLIQLGRLTRLLTNAPLGMTPGATWTFNLFTVLGLAVSEPFATVIPAGVTNEQDLTITAGSDTFVDQGNGTLMRQDGNISSTINYSTGAITLHLLVGAGTAAFVTFSYYPALPVMGDESFYQLTVNFPLQVFLDTKYSYLYNQSLSIFYDVTFYKISHHPFVWTGQNFQQFYSASYQGALWVTNNTPGMHFITIASVASGSPTTITTTGPHNLSTGDYVFIYEVTTTTLGANNLNGFSGPITRTGAYTFTIALDTTGGIYTAATGIVQFMTQMVAGQGGIRWFDGDPTTMGSTTGWVNFAPPLVSIPFATNTLPYAGLITYLVGARIIIPFKNSLLVFGAWLQASNGARIFYKNLLVFSQTGTPYYALPVPVNQTADPLAWVSDIPNRGGDLTAPIDEDIVTCGENADALIIGMESKQLVLFFTGDTSLPFQFQTINSELGSQCTFSTVNLDEGAVTVGDYGMIMTTQTSAQRIDLAIPDQVFQLAFANFGSARVTAIRDYRNELIYFTYPPFDRSWIFPNRTLVYNYRENSWATYDENFTHYGDFRFLNSETWARPLSPTWEGWTIPWDFGGSSPRYPFVACGNQQGFVMLRSEDTAEEPSQFIYDIVGNTITSPNHCLISGDYIVISGLIGGSIVPAQDSYQISVSQTLPNTFTLQGGAIFVGTYLGGGEYTRLTNINVMTKQFPIYWETQRKCRIGTQRFLLTTTELGQIIVDVFTNQNTTLPANDPGTSPYTIYSNVILTTPEPNNPYSAFQEQIWHRLSNSFNGDSVQLGFRLSDTQMLDVNIAQSEIEIHAIAMDLYPGPILV